MNGENSVPAPQDKTPLESLAEDSGQHWDQYYFRSMSSGFLIRDWLASDYIRNNYINPSISGNPDCDWLTFVVESFLRPASVQRVLDVGCGLGPVTFALARANFQYVVGIDSAEQAIESAQAAARVEGLADRAHFCSGDITGMDFPDGFFDAVVINMALHHILEIERLMELIRRWKTSQAPLVLHEYIGPNRFQWSLAAIEAGQRLLDSIPPALRKHGVTGEVVAKFQRPEYSAMLFGDRSEAIRSAEIVPITGSFFRLIERRDFGGTLLQPLLADIIHNFEPEKDPAHADILQRLFETEKSLIERGVLESNFAILVYQ